MPPVKPVGRPQTTGLREVVNAILYFLCRCCPACDFDGVSSELDGIALFTRLAGRCDLVAHKSASADSGMQGRGAQGQPVHRRHR